MATRDPRTFWRAVVETVHAPMLTEAAFNRFTAQMAGERHLRVVREDE